MNFSREKTEDLYLLTTEVENIFINEYMLKAPGDYVKVYLYGLLCSSHGKGLSAENMTCREMSKRLGLTEAQIDKAWDYWHEAGVVNKRKLGPGPSVDYDIEFRPLRALMYGAGDAYAKGSAHTPESAGSAHSTYAATDSPVYNDELRALAEEIESLLGKPLSPRDTAEIFSWVSELAATREVILAAVSYCLEKGKTGISYIAKVVTQWTADGYRTEEDVKRHLEELGLRLAKYREILLALGLNRNATKAEKEMMDRWFDEMGFTMERILEACGRGSFISNPNLRYVNGTLEKWAEEARAQGRSVNSKQTVTKAQLQNYYNYLREKAETEATERKQEVFAKLPRIKELDGELAELNRKLIREALGSDGEAKKRTEQLIDMLREERAVLLTENGFRPDYTDVRYACEKCGDTGIDDNGRQCVCVKERIREAEKWQALSSEKR